MGYEKTKQSIERTLARLDLDYLDMFLIHFPYGDYLGTWKALEEYYVQGKFKAIGVCNFAIDELQTLLNMASVSPTVNQVECHPLMQQKQLSQFLKIHNIYIYRLGAH